ncbi:hypothetical protein [Kutzneria buriramensis]|uniref:Homeodomain-like domain-containing protein n=1 Tax=Kutzneria buriramensis TaxID=1045776 RepID=A0A3E0HD28_9PSEU|nr:hypothetical protein [Kutzneria buriramensis]REH42704.1 hypothetical protein BCF44_110201 [Kutzneria buriramensis]
MADVIKQAEQQREAVLEEAAAASEQHRAWRDERNRLIIQASALNISHRRIASYVGLSDVWVGKIVKGESDGEDVPGSV